MPERSKFVLLPWLAGSWRQGRSAQVVHGRARVTEKRAPTHETPPPPRRGRRTARPSDKAPIWPPSAHRRTPVMDTDVDADPKSALAYRARGQIHLSRGNYEKAILDFAKVTDLKPLDPQAWFDRALLTTVSRSMPNCR